jgi:hypothetical protein
MKVLSKIMGVVFGVLGVGLLLDLYLYYTDYLERCTAHTKGIELFFPAFRDAAIEVCNDRLIQSDQIGMLVFMVAFALLSCYAGYVLLFNNKRKSV